MELTIINDIKTWNGFLEKINPAAFFQDFLWNRIYDRSHINSAPLGIFIKDELIGLSLGHLVKAKRGTFLHIRHGPVFDTEFIKQKNIWRDYLTCIKNFAGRYNAWFVRISPRSIKDDGAEEFFRDLGCIKAPIQALDGELCWMLDVTKDNTELLKDMRKTTRYLIRKGQNMGIKITDKPQIGNFLELYRETAARQGFVAHQDVDSEWQVFNKEKRAFMLLGYFEGQLLSGGIFVKMGDEVIYRHGASKSSAIPVSYLLQWLAISQAKKMGAKYYNFWGIAPAVKSNHPWKGITLFKQGFGGSLVEYQSTLDIVLSPKYVLSYMIESLRRVYRGY